MEYTSREADREAFAKKYPEVEIIGNLFSDSKILKLGKPRLENEGVIRKGELISLKHSMPGVTIRISKIQASLIRLSRKFTKNHLR